jgi:hypothetical protein
MRNLLRPCFRTRTETYFKAPTRLVTLSRPKRLYSEIKVGLAIDQRYKIMEEQCPKCHHPMHKETEKCSQCDCGTPKTS